MSTESSLPTLTAGETLHRKHSTIVRGILYRVYRIASAHHSRLIAIRVR